MKLKTKHLHAALIILLSFIIYFNTFFNPFVFDDQFFIADNFEIRSLKNIPSYFSEPSVGNLYRPLRTVLYSITFFMWKLNPIGYHLSAILLYTLVSILAYLIVFEITGNRKFSFIVSLLFVVHPVHTARVANMTASFDLLGILFMFLSIWMYIRYNKDNCTKNLVLSIIFFLFGLFSSEEVLMTPLYIFLYKFGRDKGATDKGISNRKVGLSLFIVIPVAFLALRYFVLGQVGRTAEYFMGGFITRILSTAVIFLRYLRILFFPFGLTVDYYVKLYDPISLLPIVGFLVILAIILVALLNRKKNFLVYFFLGWFLIGLIPFSNILPVTTFMADRYLFTASFGFIVLLSYALLSLGKRYKKASLVLLILVFAGYCYGTISRNSEWSSDITLEEIAVKRQPLSSVAYNNLGFEYDRISRTEEAFIAYETSIMLNPLNHIAWLNLGTLYGTLGDYSNGIELINRSINIFPSYKAYNNMGLLYRSIKDHASAVFYLKKAIETNPRMSKAHMDLGITLAEMGKTDMALEEFNKALKINPYSADTHYNLAILYEILNQTDKAKKEFNIAYRLDPTDNAYKVCD